MASTPVPYDAAQYVFTKERLPAVAIEGMMMIGAGEDALCGYDLVGMDRRLNDVAWELVPKLRPLRTPILLPPLPFLFTLYL